MTVSRELGSLSIVNGDMGDPNAQIFFNSCLRSKLAFLAM